MNGDDNKILGIIVRIKKYKVIQVLDIIIVVVLTDISEESFLWVKKIMNSVCKM